ncbi:MAG: peptidylprolyl isomerase [Candidatus Latescibacterota bacterium]|nr:MAG: peptidylprolyl isomerase [Candidatus Latescibacterota bacterium]
MKEGDFIRIDYIGRIKESGQIFDLTDEKLAKEKGMYNPNVSYRPVPVIIGGDFVIKGLEAELKKMKVGEKKRFSVKPEDAFGQRTPKLIKLIPMSEFYKRNMVPYQGMSVTINNLMGRVLSVSGGRVRVDFNHPLAGKELEYDLEIKEKITNKKEKVEAVIEFFYKPVKKQDVSFEGKTVEIKFESKADVPKQSKEKIANTILKWIKNVEKVRFVEEYT